MFLRSWPGCVDVPTVVAGLFRCSYGRGRSWPGCASLRVSLRVSLRQGETGAATPARACAAGTPSPPTCPHPRNKTPPARRIIARPEAHARRSARVQSEWMLRQAKLKQRNKTQTHASPCRRRPKVEGIF